MNTFFIETLPQATAVLIDQFQEKPQSFLHNFYLSGGTALSLQLGHRESEDLDFFSQDIFNPQQLERELSRFGQLSQTELAPGTVNTFLQGVKLQFLEYPYPLLESTKAFNQIALSSVLDIACTKLQTIGMRGSKKDFIDLYFLLERYSLSELFSATEKKYSQVNYSQTHILKSLVYFGDAENQPMPRMHKKVDWEDIKSTIIEKIKNVSF